MILYFTGTGNSAYAAKQIAQATGDEAVDLFDRINNKDHSFLSSQKPWVITVPTYAWQIPHIIRDWLLETELRGSREIYFVMTCGSGIGNASKSLKKLCALKKLIFKGCAEIVMPENYIAMFAAPGKEEAKRIIKKADPLICSVAEYIGRGVSLPENRNRILDRFCSGPVNWLFYRFIISAKKFIAKDGCISCNTCADVCPMGNIKLVDGKPIWGKDCTHCMACICSCPKEVIEYGAKSRGKNRYLCPSNSLEDRS